VLNFALVFISSRLSVALDSKRRNTSEIYA